MLEFTAEIAKNAECNKSSLCGLGALCGEFIRSSLFGCAIALSRAHRRLRSDRADVELVHLAVEHLGREPEHVLMMQFVGDALYGRRDIVGPRQLEISAAGRLRDLRQAIVRLFFLRDRAAAS